MSGIRWRTPEPTDGRRILASVMIPALLFACSIVFLSATLSKEGFWLDELFTIAYSEPDLPLRRTLELLKGETNPPLYFLLVKYWRAAFHTDEYVVRLLGAAVYYGFGVLTYVFARARFSETPALLYIFFYLFSYFAVRYLSEARPYILVFALASFLVAYSVGCITHAIKLSIALILGLLVVLLSYLHFFGALIGFSVLGACFCFLEWNKRRSESALILGVAVIALVLYAPVLIFVLTNAPDTATWWLKFNPRWSILGFGYLAFSGYVGCAIVSILALSIIYNLRLFKVGNLRTLAYPEVVLPIVYCMIGVTIAFGISIWRPVVTPRNLAVFAPCAYFVLAILLVKSLDRYRCSLAVLLIGYAFNTWVLAYYDRKEDWRAASEFLRSYVTETGCPVPSVDLSQYEGPRAEVVRRVYGYYMRDAARFLQFDGPKKVANCPVIYFGWHRKNQGREALRAALHEAGFSDYDVLEFYERVYVVSSDRRPR